MTKTLKMEVMEILEDMVVMKNSTMEDEITNVFKLLINIKILEI